MTNQIRDRGSTMAMAILAMLIFSIPAVIATPASPTNDDSSPPNINITATIDLDKNIADATMATPTAKHGSTSPASTDATFYDDMTFTAKATASPPAATLTNESIEFATLNIGTTAANPELTNLGYGDRLIDDYATDYNRTSEVYRLLTRLDENSAKTDAAIVIRI